MEIVIFTSGLISGAFFCWLFFRLKGGDISGTSIESYRTQADQLRMEKVSLAEKLAWNADSVIKLESELHKERKISAEWYAQLAETRISNQFLEEQLKNEREGIKQLQQKFTEQFENVANRIFFENSNRIQEQHKEKLHDILSPLKDKIEGFEKKVGETQLEYARDNQSIREQLMNLQQLNQTIGMEAHNLAMALKGNTKTQGNWGEMILENLLEASGLTKGIEYRAQESHQSEQGKRVQPDIVIYLPEEKNLVIDAKVSLTSFERFCNAEEKSERGMFLSEHVQSLRKHIRELGQKNYQNLYSLKSPDFVLMFVPVESALNLACNETPGLFQEAYERNVIMVSTSTLLSTLRTISGLWKQEKQNRNALEIARKGGEMYDKFVNFIADLRDVENKMDSTRRSLDEAMKKLHSGNGNLVKRAEDIRKLGAKATKSLPSGLVGDESENTDF